MRINITKTTLKLSSSIAVLILVSTSATSFSQRTARILVGPNVLVSRESDQSVMEHYAAADPTNVLNLLGTAIVHRTYSKGGPETMGYLSRDAGNTWRTFSFPELSDSTSVDPLVEYGRTGTAFFVTLSKFDRQTGMFIWRSDDSGATWGKPTYVYQVDHPQIVVDRSSGRFAGNIYINALGGQSHGRGDYHISMFRSSDDGRSWIGPVTVATNHAHPGRGFQAQQPLVFSDGELFAPFDSWWNSEPEKVRHRKNRGHTYEYGFAVSKNGGASFSQQHKLSLGENEYIVGSSRPFFAIDNSDGPYRDRVYIAYADNYVSIDKDGRIVYESYADNKPSRIYLSYSSNRGKTWTKPRTISASPKGDQFDICIAVNNEGTLAVSYHDTRDTPKNRDSILINRYISVSIDGGQTFLPAKRITSVPSDPATLNRNILGASLRIGLAIKFESGASLYADYQGMATDLNGVFHPFWSDGRNGTNQSATAAVRVERLDNISMPQGTVSTHLEDADVSTLIEPHFEPLRKHPQPGTIEVPIRLRNKSDKSIYGPIKVELVPHKAADWVPNSPFLADYYRDTGELLNSLNGKTGIGALIDYTGALGDYGVLIPNAMTESVIWQFKAPATPREFPNFKIKVTGRVERTKEGRMGRPSSSP